MKKFKVLEEGRFTKGELEKVKGGSTCKTNLATCTNNVFYIVECAWLLTCGTGGRFKMCDTQRATCGTLKDYSIRV